jgi:hypothetical protein
MIPRRLYEHVRSHNWFAVSIDFIIVVVGVFIGIQVANWNADRLERREARAYVERIREDLGTSARSLESLVTYYRQVKAHALAALDAFDGPPAAGGEQFLIDAFQASQLLMRTVERSTYDEILSAGAMNSIPSLEARRRLANYYKNIAAIEDLIRYVPPYRESLRRRMPYPVQAAMFERCDDIASVDSLGAAMAALPERCELGLSAATVAAAVASIHDPELKLDLVRRLSDLDTKLENYQRLLDRGKALDGFLAEERF